MREVAITGLGIVSALGRGGRAHLSALRSGKTGLRRLELFQAEGIRESPVGQVEESLLEPVAPGGSLLGRSERLALAAASDALASSKALPPEAGAIVLGTTTGGIHESEQHYLRHRGADGEQERHLLRHHAAGAIADRLASAFSLDGERHTFSTACSSSANAIGYAATLVAAGAPWALAGGVDSLCRLTFAGFHALKLLSSSACRPFDRHRSGLSLGEGAAFVVLESPERARARGAQVLATVAGWGCTADAHHPTAPHPEGRGAIEAIRGALDDAGINPSQVSYVNAHGTATPANDHIEAIALRAVFGDGGPLVSSTKGATGHTLGAAGAIEAVLTVLCLREGFAPPTIGLSEPDPEAALRHVPLGGAPGALKVALSSSFGFGGNNAVLVLKRGES